ncbi:hypothetical protein TYRP_005347 [Tyrophagus putrescentiae]|nr:hypothetical protein TYRP_005347 [Tyrophagus putrescentiae]
MILQNISYYLDDFWTEYGDPRVAHLLLMGSMRSPLILLLSYLAWVLALGPFLMSTRRPFELKRLLLLYNLFMTLMNGYFLYNVFIYWRFVVEKATDFRYPIVTPTLTDFEAEVLPIKDSQITGLHVYHHASVAAFAWLYFRSNCTPNILIPFMVINTTIHVIMYAYYGLASLGPQMAPYLWWKRYITQLQLLQFAVLFLYGVAFALFQTGYPQWMCTNQIVQAVVYMVLFSRFYLQTYRRKIK